MAILENDEENIYLEINLINNKYLDLESDSDYEKWVPFQLVLKVPGKEYAHLDGDFTFNVYEVKQLLLNLRNKINEKKKNKKISNYSFYCSEAYFEFNLDETLEEGLLEVSLWLNMGEFTNGKYCGFYDGYRFVVTIESLESFCQKIEMEFNNLLI